jgi:hypothetical protein
MWSDLKISRLFVPPRLDAILLLAVALVVSGQPVGACNHDNANSLRKACQYLWSQQADDGGWHSRQYAVLRSGQALTPFVLHTLLQVPESVCQKPESGVERALDFIRKHADDRGSLGHADPDVVEYPVYSTAYALRCLALVGRDRDAELAHRMQDFLIEAQFGPRNGFEPRMAAYGGWGFDQPFKPGESGHMDLAHTRRAIEALRAANDRWPMPDHIFDMAADRTQRFLRVVQRRSQAVASPPQSDGSQRASHNPSFDGGFYFSPIVLAANKGREESNEQGSGNWRSYATATCDGLLALLAWGRRRDDERVARATAWLKAHDDIDYPQGVPQNHPEPWGTAIRFYHYAVRAEVYSALDLPGDWRTRIAAAVAKRQAADGSFRNTDSPLMKEDDPVLCTTLATIALRAAASP